MNYIIASGVSVFAIGVGKYLDNNIAKKNKLIVDAINNIAIYDNIGDIPYRTSGIVKVDLGTEKDDLILKISTNINKHIPSYYSVKEKRSVIGNIITVEKEQCFFPEKNYIINTPISEHINMSLFSNIRYAVRPSPDFKYVFTPYETNTVPYYRSGQDLVKLYNHIVPSLNLEPSHTYMTKVIYGGRFYLYGTNGSSLNPEFVFTHIAKTPMCIKDELIKEGIHIPYGAFFSYCLGSFGLAFSIIGCILD